MKRYVEEFLYGILVITGYALLVALVVALVIGFVLSVIFSCGFVHNLIHGLPMKWYEIASPIYFCFAVGIFFATMD